MNPGRWERIEEIFEVALSMAGQSRRDYLASTCDGDANLRAEVEAMIAAQAPGLTLQIERLVTEETGAKPLLGAELGPWRVLRVLGSGGTGTVYLAERADGQYQQRVALKLVAPAWNRALGRARQLPGAQAQPR